MVLRNSIMMRFVELILNLIYNYYNFNMFSLQLKSLVHRFGRGPGMDVLNMTLSSVASNVEWVARSQTSLYKWVESNLHSH